MRYGKPNAPLLGQKASFFEENELHVQRQRVYAEMYRKQARREFCKNCEDRLPAAPDFTKDGIGYILCDICGHLNGAHDDSDEFHNAVYASSENANYYKSADINSYNSRVTSIYLAKAEFLYTSLQGNGVDPQALSYLDFGCGSGHFVAGLKRVGLTAVQGIELSPEQVEYGNKMIGEPLLSITGAEHTHRAMRDTRAGVVSMIHVLEHLKQPRRILEEIVENKNIKYVYLAVPMFSLSVYLELLSPDVFHRQLHGGHTHLYTERSLSHLCTEFGLERISEWWFGADICDLFRHVLVAAKGIKSSEKLADLWRRDFAPLIDPLQLELDRGLYSSEVHMVLKKA